MNQQVFYLIINRGENRARPSDSQPTYIWIHDRRATYPYSLYAFTICETCKCLSS